jgi:hypothetical protein
MEKPSSKKNNIRKLQVSTKDRRRVRAALVVKSGVRAGTNRGA